MGVQVSITLRMVRNGSEGVTLKESQRNTCENMGFISFGLDT